VIAFEARRRAQVAGGGGGGGFVVRDSVAGAEARRIVPSAAAPDSDERLGGLVWRVLGCG